MQNKWEKLGLIFEPNPEKKWMVKHAQNPMPIKVSDDTFRVFFSSRSEQNQAHGGFFDFNMKTKQVINVPDDAVIKPGELGAFDDSGVMPSSINNINGKFHLYYTGWTPAVSVPFHFHIGLAISDTLDGSFERYSRAPVLDRNFHDPFIVGAPFVIEVENGYRLYYCACTKWTKEDGNIKHYYTIKYAESIDGLDWKTNSHLCIPYSENEYAIARPIVWKEGELYFMWFSYRGGDDTYRIGEAISKDGINWDRKDQPVDIDISEEGWDNQMVCYGHPFFYEGKKYAFYNGNNYGETGIGLALFNEK